MQPSVMPDDSAHDGDIDRNAPDPKICNAAYESSENAQPEMKLQQDLEGAVSPLEPVIPNPPARHCDPHHYRYASSNSDHVSVSRMESFVVMTCKLSITDGHLVMDSSDWLLF